MDWKGAREQIHNAVMVVLNGHMKVTHKPSASHTSLDYDIGLYGGSFLLSVKVDHGLYRFEMLTAGRLVGNLLVRIQSFKPSDILAPVRKVARQISLWESWQMDLMDAFDEVGYVNRTFERVERGRFKVLLSYDAGRVYFEMHYGSNGSKFYQFLEYITEAVIEGSRHVFTEGATVNRDLLDSITVSAFGYLLDSSEKNGGSVADAQGSPSANSVDTRHVPPQTSRPWKDRYMLELDKRMCVTGGGDGGPNELRRVIDMFGVQFTFEMTDPGKEDFQIKCLWDAGDEISDTVHSKGVSTSDLISTIVTKIRNRVSKKSGWSDWQKSLVNELCDKGVVPGRTGQTADETCLRLMLSKGGSNFEVEIHFGGPFNPSCKFVSCSRHSVLIQRTWNKDVHPPSINKIAGIIFDDLEKAPAIEKDDMSPIHTGPGSEIVSGAGGGAVVSPGANAAITKLRLYEAVVDLLIRYRGGRISEESVNTVSELLQTLDTVSH
jgi:hypothetical protein